MALDHAPKTLFIEILSNDRRYPERILTGHVPHHI